MGREVILQLTPKCAPVNFLPGAVAPTRRTVVMVLFVSWKPGPPVMLPVLLNMHGKFLYLSCVKYIRGFGFFMVCNLHSQWKNVSNEILMAKYLKLCDFFRQ